MNENIIRSPLKPSPNDNNYHRLKYYSALKSGFKHLGVRSSFLSVPSHIVDPNNYVINIANPSEPTKNQSSLSTIFSIWNTMIGSGILTIPWAFSNSGFLFGIIVTFIAFAASLYTCILVVRSAKYDDDFADTVYKYYGSYGWLVTMLFSVILMLGVTLVYFELICQALFPTMSAIIQWVFGHESPTGFAINFTEFTYSYVPLILFVILLPVVMKKDLKIFMKINTYGVFFLSGLLVFIIAHGFIAFSNTEFVISNEPNDYSSSTRNIALFKRTFSPLAGMLCLGFYLHNISLPILKNNSNPKNNIRDLTIGYSLVFICYIVVGVLGYVGFSASTFTNDIEQNVLMMYSSTNAIAFFIRICNFIQLFSVFPLLFFISRQQSFSLFKSTRYNDTKPMFIANISFLIVITTFAIVYPEVGKILGVLGAISGLFLIYIIPNLVNLRKYRLQNQDPVLAEAIDKNNIEPIKNDDKAFLKTPKFRITSSTISNVNGSISPSLVSGLNGSKVFIENMKEVNSNWKLKYAMHIFISLMIFMLGIITLVFQFVTL